jgi:hypothetical protein
LVMNLGISGVSLSSQSKSLVDQNDKSDVKEAKSNQEKKQYVTEQEGNYECTYVVIGDNFKVLISRVSTKKDKDEAKTEGVDKKNTHVFINNDQSLMGHLQVAATTLPKNNLQERIKAMGNYDASPYQDIAKVDSKG